MKEQNDVRVHQQVFILGGNRMSQTFLIIADQMLQLLDFCLFLIQQLPGFFQQRKVVAQDLDFQVQFIQFCFGLKIDGSGLLESFFL